MAKSNAFVERNCYDTENKLLLKEKEVYDKIVSERRTEINTLNNKTEYDKLKYNFQSEKRILIKVSNFNCPLALIRKIKDDSTDLKKAKQKKI